MCAALASTCWASPADLATTPRGCSAGPNIVILAGMGRAPSRRLSNATFYWAQTATQCDPTSKAKYQALRARGHSHARALRSVVDRLLYVACAMLEKGTLFDPSFAEKNNAAA